MSKVRFLWMGVVSAFLLLAGASSAMAQSNRRLLVLVDTTGSMTATCVPGPSNPNCHGQTRFELARELAEEYVNRLRRETLGLRDVAVYSFDSGSGWLAHTTGFQSADTAINQIRGISVSPYATPLADAMCASVKQLENNGQADTDGDGDLDNLDLRFAFFTDGDENASFQPDCSGPPSGDPDPTYEDGSWQNKVYLTIRDSSPHVSVDTYYFSTVGFTAKSQPAREIGARQLAASCAPGQPCAQVLDSSFFAAIAQVSGGRFVQVRDDQPVPVFGDIDSDHCVSRADALLVARQFGHAPTAQFDVDNDGVVGYGDYSFVTSQIGAGCLSAPADPYINSGPLACPANGGTLTIDGKAVSSATFPVSGGHNCRIVIRNSLVVGGLDAISMNGNNRVTVDNSIVVGQRGVIGVVGFTKLSAAKTVFHGPKTEPDGALEYVDRGGNVWEE